MKIKKSILTIILTTLLITLLVGCGVNSGYKNQYIKVSRTDIDGKYYRYVAIGKYNVPFEPRKTEVIEVYIEKEVVYYILDSDPNKSLELANDKQITIYKMLGRDGLYVKATDITKIKLQVGD